MNNAALMQREHNFLGGRPQGQIFEIIAAEIGLRERSGKNWGQNWGQAIVIKYFLFFP